MAEEYKLEQVSVRLKLMEEAPLYNTQAVNSPDRAIEVMREMMKDLDREYVCVINLDNSTHPINFSIVSMGTLNSSLVSMRELFKTSILSNAVIHNHPSSNITPSKEDNAITAKVMMAAKTMDIPLLDHIIVGGGTGNYYSYKEEMRGKFSLEGMQKLLQKSGIEGFIAEKPQEYKPLAKVEELEEENYNQIDNYLSNTRPKAEERKERQQTEIKKTKYPFKDRPSVLAKIKEKKAIVDARKVAPKEPYQRQRAERVI